MRPTIALLLVLAACPRPIPPPGPAADASTCLAPAVLVEASICDGYFDAAGHACARCQNEAGCVDRATQIRCAAGPCAFDQACALEPESGVLRGPGR